MSRPVILFVDDNEHDAVLMREALRRGQVHARYHHVDNPQQALDYLTGFGKYGDRKKYPLPAVLLLDIHMPGVSGVDLLAWLRSKDEFQDLPIILISGATIPLDPVQAANLRVAGSFRKTATYDEPVEFLRRLLKSPQSTVHSPQSTAGQSDG